VALLVNLLLPIICEINPGAAMQRSCNFSGNGAMIGTPSSSLRGTYLRRINRRRKNRAG